MFWLCGHVKIKNTGEKIRKIEVILFICIYITVIKLNILSLFLKDILEDKFFLKIIL